MNFRSVTINLLLTTLSGGVLLQTLEAQAASITFDPWVFKTEVKETTRFGATAKSDGGPHNLQAFAEAAPTLNPLSWHLQRAVTTATLSTFFTVKPDEGEKNGDLVKGILSGRLEGVLWGRGVGLGLLEGFDTSVRATVNAGGFQPKDIMELHNGTVPLWLAVDEKPVKQDIAGEGILIIGNKYPLDMSLTVSASKGAAYQAVSNFMDDGRGLTVNVDVEGKPFPKPFPLETIPEPLTIFGSATGVGFAAFFKRKHSKK
jgi:hypothetical protein